MNILRVRLGAVVSFFVFCLFSLGIICAARGGSFWVYAAAACAGLAAAVAGYAYRRIGISDSALAVCIVCIGACWYAGFSRDTAARMFEGQSALCRLKVVSIPREYGFKNTFTALVTAINTAPSRFKIKVIDYSRRMEYLGSYEVAGTIGRPQFANSVFWTLWIKSSARVGVLPVLSRDALARNATQWFLSVFGRYLTPQAYQFMSSVFLGRRELYPEGTKIFADAGIAHLIAISGSHIALAAAVIFFMLRLLYVPRRIGIVISLVVLGAYSVITGMSPPVVRSLIMYGIISAGFLLKRRLSPYNVLGLAGLMCLVMNPAWLFNAGFQLSFVSVFGLIYGFRAFPVGSAEGWHNCIKYVFFASWWATVFIIPFVSYHFGKVHTLAIANNVLLVPLFSGLMIAAFVFVLFGCIPCIAQPLGAVISIGVWLFMRLTERIGAVKFSFWYYQMPIWQGVLYYSILGFILWYAKRWWKRRKKRAVLQTGSGMLCGVRKP